MTYKLDDGTGTIEAKQWLDSETMDEGLKTRIPENSYVRVMGKLKPFGNRRHVGAHFIRPISDFNEISCHLLEATAVHLFFTRGPPGGAKAGAAAGAKQQDATMAYGGAALLSSLTPTARKVLNCLQTSPQSNEGLHCEDIAARLGMNAAEVGKGGDELLEHGLIYPTVNDETWAILNTDGMGY
jgi:replication factor A2